jgi:hypothetical protein
VAVTVRLDEAPARVAELTATSAAGASTALAAPLTVDGAVVTTTLDVAALGVLAEGTSTLSLLVEDAVQNVARRELASVIVIDRTPPGAHWHKKACQQPIISWQSTKPSSSLSMPSPQISGLGSRTHDALHPSPEVPLPSSHCSFVCWIPSPQNSKMPSLSTVLPSSHISRLPLLTTPSPQHSTRHDELHPSPEVELPSSHCSPAQSCTPLPQNSKEQDLSQPSPSMRCRRRIAHGRRC